jgi:hypothetical protein
MWILATSLARLGPGESTVYKWGGNHVPCHRAVPNNGIDANTTANDYHSQRYSWSGVRHWPLYKIHNCLPLLMQQIMVIPPDTNLLGSGRDYPDRVVFRCLSGNCGSHYPGRYSLLWWYNHRLELVHCTLERLSVQFTHRATFEIVVCHPRWTHAVVNMFILFGPMALFLHASSAITMFRRSTKTTVLHLSTLHQGCVWTIVSGLSFLSLAPHQEPRFLYSPHSPTLYRHGSDKSFRSPVNVRLLLDRFRCCIVCRIWNRTSGRYRSSCSLSKRHVQSR